MTVNRSFVAAVTLTAAIAMSAVGATALAAPKAASPFELTLEYEWSSDIPSRPLEGTSRQGRRSAARGRPSSSRRASALRRQNAGSPAATAAAA